MVPKDKDNIMQKSEMIHGYLCDEDYFRESTITFGERFKGYLKTLKPYYEHGNVMGHHTSA